MSIAESRSPTAAILCEVIGAVGVATLNRPAQINAINDDIRTGLPEALRAFDADDAVRAIVIHGGEGRGFCVGADIKEFREAETAIGARRRLRRGSWVEALDEISKPVVAAVHGFCFGGGLEIALACDIRIAAPNASFSLPEVGLGLIPGGGGTQRLTRLVGLGRALDLLLTGDRIDAAEALRLGLVTRLSDSDDDVRAVALRLAQSLGEKPPSALAYAKEAARKGFELDLKAALGLERDLFSVLIDSDDRREAAAAFREKRKPRFS